MKWKLKVTDLLLSKMYKNNGTNYNKIEGGDYFYQFVIFIGLKFAVKQLLIKFNNVLLYNWLTTYQSKLLHVIINIYTHSQSEYLGQLVMHLCNVIIIVVCSEKIVYLNNYSVFSLLSIHRLFSKLLNKSNDDNQARVPIWWTIAESPS